MGKNCNLILTPMYERKLNVLDESRGLATQAIAQKSNSYEEYYARAKGQMDRYDHNDAVQSGVIVKKGLLLTDLVYLCPLHYFKKITFNLTPFLTSFAFFNYHFLPFFLALFRFD
uniref:Uncharacterized protein n=1 Tax=Glossina austeni TaxID=7395 RepID=A0A1A9UFV5_GLOAU